MRIGDIFKRFAWKRLPWQSEGGDVTVIKVTFLWLLCFCGLWYLNIDTLLETKIGDPIRFAGRSYLGAEPNLNPKLKIFVIDDQTVAELGKSRPSLSTWIKALDAIIKQKPQTIIIDSIFVERPEPLDLADQNLLDSIRQSNIPIITGAYAARQNLRLKKKFELSATPYNVDSYRPSDAGQTAAHWLTRHIPILPDQTGWNVYGAHENVSHLFFNVGHLHFAENRLHPFLRVGEKNVLPHISMRLSNDISFVDRNIRIDGEPVTLDRNGLLPVNFLTQKHRLLKSFQSVISASQRSEPAEAVNVGDIVVIICGYFTGGTDFKPYPLGRIPGGFYTVDAINTILNQDYLRPLNIELELAMILIIAAASIYWILSTSLSWLAWIGLTLFTIAISQVCFAYFNLIIPFVGPLMMGTLAGANVYLLKVVGIKLAQLKMAQELETAQLVQEKFFPPSRIDCENLVITSLHRSASECSGDWWGHFQVGPFRHLVVLADVTGHGVPAALMTASLHSITHLCVDLFNNQNLRDYRPSQIMQFLNQSIHHSGKFEMFATASLVEIDTFNQTITHLNAGHLAPLIVQKKVIESMTKWTVSPVIVKNNPLGVNEKEEFNVVTRPFNPGDKIFLFSDGLIEWKSRNGTCLKTRRIYTGLQEMAIKDGRQILEHFYSEAQSLAGTTPQSDDVTMIMIEFHDPVIKAA